MRDTEINACLVAIEQGKRQGVWRQLDANPQNLVFPEAPSLLIDANGKMITKWF
jgi:hypothetical protein